MTTDLQHAEIVSLLTAIRDDLRAGLRELKDVLLMPPPEPGPCAHPLEMRTDPTPGAPFWKCNACGYVYDNEREF